MLQSRWQDLLQGGFLQVARVYLALLVLIITIIIITIIIIIMTIIASSSSSSTSLLCCALFLVGSISEFFAFEVKRPYTSGENIALVNSMGRSRKVPFCVNFVDCKCYPRIWVIFSANIIELTSNTISSSAAAA